MSREQVTVGELLLRLDSAELQEAEQAKASVHQQLSSERGGAVIGSLVDHYLDSSSPQVLLLLSSTRETLHKVLLEKLNDVLSRPATRLVGISLLGHLISKQPPWVHHVTQSPLLPTLLRSLKTDGDVLVLVTGVLVLVTLLPMIPQAGKQNIYDFFDVFGRLTGWGLKNPGQASEVQLVHLQAALYSLFQLLYGMFPCSFISYLRLHYSMKENQETFLLLVQPMLEQVRVHPELITGSQDSEMDPSRWRCSEVHDIIVECSRVSLDPLESFCDDPQLTPSPHLDLNWSEKGTSMSLTDSCSSQVDDVTWSPSLKCGLSTPPSESVPLNSTSILDRSMSVSEERRRPAADPVQVIQVKLTPTTELPPSVSLPVPEWEGPSEGSASQLTDPSTLHPLTSSPGGPIPSTPSTPPTVGSCTPSSQANTSPLLYGWSHRNHTCALSFLEQKTQERGQGRLWEERLVVSPLQVLDQLIIRGDDAHQHLREWPSRSRCLDLPAGGQNQEGELQAARSQLLLLHAQLQYERFKCQQHAARNRRLLRRVLDSSAQEEQSVVMRSQLSVQNQEIQTLLTSLDEEQRRVRELRRHADLQTSQLQMQTQLLLQEQQEQRTHMQRLQDQLLEFENKVGVLEAELQVANHEAVNAQRKLSQLAIKASSSEQLQQQVDLLDQQLLLLQETNKRLRRAGPELQNKYCEASMLHCIMVKEHQLLKQSELQQRQKLEAANQRAADMENQLRTKDELILNQKSLLEDTKTQMRAELSACESACVSLRQVVQTLQTEMLNLYSHLDVPTSRPKNGSSALPVTQVSHKRRPSSASVSIHNGRAESFPSSPVDSPLPVGSFLGQRARQLFRPADQRQEDDPVVEEDPGSPPLSLEEEEVLLLSGSSPLEVLSEAGHHPEPTLLERRRQLTIMDYNQMLPEV